MRERPHQARHADALAALRVVALALVASCSDEAGGEHLDAGSDQDVEGGARLTFQELTLEEPVVSVTDMAFVPGAVDELLLLEQAGTIRHVRLADDVVETLGRIEVADVYQEQDCGLVSLAFDPDFEDNGLIYVGHCTTRRFSRVTRLTFDPTDYNAVAATAAVVIEAGDGRDGPPWHNVGQMGFDEAGHMWVLFGDKFRSDNAQNLDNVLGSLLRITPNRDGSGYTVPDDNPFVGNDQARDEIVAYGLRSPWRAVHDRLGRLWIADVGELDREEVDVIDYPVEEAVDFGWPYWEGTLCRDEGNCGEHTAPIIDWGREANDPLTLEDPLTEPVVSRVVYVALDYGRTPQDRYDGLIDNRVIYGDLCAGWVRAMELGQSGEIVEDGLVGHLPNPTAWALGPDGSVYATTYGACHTNNPNPPEGRFWRAVLAD